MAMDALPMLEQCCPIVRDAPISVSDAVRVAAALKVLADPARIRLLSLIASEPEDGCCVCDLTEPLDLSQPTVSHHVKVLHEAGFLSREKVGTWVHYRLIPESLTAVCGLLAPAGAVLPV